MSTPQVLPGNVKDQVIAGFTQAASRYDTGGTEFFKDMGARLVDQAQVQPGARVLDVGCGKGAVTLPAARLAGDTGRVHAIDLAAPMLDAAAAQARACGLGTITFARGDAEDPPFPAGTFDVILAGNVIQFLPNPARAADRWRALLTPGGTLAFSWGLAQDPRWEPVMAAVDAHVPPGMTGFEAFLRRSPFGGIDPVEQMLTGTGYQAVQTVTHQVDTVYHNPDQWWAACQSQAPWAISWRHIPPHKSRPPKPPRSVNWRRSRNPAAPTPGRSRSPAPPPAGRREEKRPPDPVRTGNVAARISRIPHQPVRHQ